MDNTEKPINDECACSIDYEAAYQNAMKELDEMWREQVFKDCCWRASKDNFTVRTSVTITCTKEKLYE